MAWLKKCSNIAVKWRKFDSPAPIFSAPVNFIWVQLMTGGKMSRCGEMSSRKALLHRYSCSEPLQTDMWDRCATPRPSFIFLSMWLALLVCVCLCICWPSAGILTLPPGMSNLEESHCFCCNSDSRLGELETQLSFTKTVVISKNLATEAFKWI